MKSVVLMLDAIPGVERHFPESVRSEVSALITDCRRARRAAAQLIQMNPDSKARYEEQLHQTFRSIASKAAALLP